MEYKRRVGRPVGQSDDLSVDELRAIIALPDRRTTEGLRDYAVLLMFLNTPARIGEVCSMKVGHLDDNGKSPAVSYEVLKKRSGRKKWVRVPIDRGVFDGIMRYVKAEYRNKKLHASDPLFYTLGKFGPYKKRPITDDAVRGIVAKYARLAGIQKRVTPHSFRASYLTLRAPGRDPATLLGLSSHADIRGIMPYIRTSEAKKQEAALSIQIS